jgi:hypothetical protein
MKDSEEGDVKTSPEEPEAESAHFCFSSFLSSMQGEAKLRVDLQVALGS